MLRHQLNKNCSRSVTKLKSCGVDSIQIICICEEILNKKTLLYWLKISLPGITPTLFWWERKLNWIKVTLLIDIFNGGACIVST